MATTNAKIRVKRDTRANWVTANPTLSSGQVGFITDEKMLKVGDGSTAFDSLGGLSAKRTIVLSAVNPTDTEAVATGGVRGAEFVADFAGVITGWKIIGRPTNGQANGSCTLDIWKKASGGGWPTNSDSITAAAKPAMSAALEVSSTTMTGWTTSFSAGDKFALEVESATTLSAITLVLTVEAR